MSNQTVTFRNTFIAIVQARLGVKLSAAVNHFVNLHTCHTPILRDVTRNKHGRGSESEDNFDEGTKMASNQMTTEREYNREFIVSHFVFIKLSFTRTWQCQPLFYKASFLPKH